MDVFFFSDEKKSESEVVGVGVVQFAREPPTHTKTWRIEGEGKKNIILRKEHSFSQPFESKLSLSSDRLSDKRQKSSLSIKYERLSSSM